jgi:hypothetical protein
MATTKKDTEATSDAAAIARGTVELERHAALAEIESAAGIQLAKNQYAYRAATRETKGTVPAMLKQILTKAGGV